MRLYRWAAGVGLMALAVVALCGASAGLSAASGPAPYDGTWRLTIGGSTTDSANYGYLINCCSASQPVLIRVTNGAVSLSSVSYVPAFTLTGTIGSDGVGRFLIYIAGYNKTTASESAPAGENPCSIQIRFKLEGTGPGFADAELICRTDFTDSSGGSRTVEYSGAFHALQTSTVKPTPTAKAKPKAKPKPKQRKAP